MFDRSVSDMCQCPCLCLAGLCLAGFLSDKFVSVRSVSERLMSVLVTMFEKSVSVRCV